MGRDAALVAIESRCYGSSRFLTVVLDNSITDEHDALDLWPVVAREPEGELILLLSEGSDGLFRGIAYGALMCLCFWIPLASAIAIAVV